MIPDSGFSNLALKMKIMPARLANRGCRCGVDVETSCRAQSTGSIEARTHMTMLDRIVAKSLDGGPSPRC